MTAQEAARIDEAARRAATDLLAEVPMTCEECRRMLARSQDRKAA